MMNTRFIFNYFVIENPENSQWEVYERLDKRIPKRSDCYGSRVLGTGETADDAIADAGVKNKVERWSVEVIKVE